MIDFFPLFTAFAATLVGIIGNTWDKRKRGFHRLTTTGRAAVALGVASLAYGTGQSTTRTDRFQTWPA